MFRDRSARRWARLLSVLAIFGLVVAACGGDDDDDSSTADTEAPSEEGTDLLGPEDVASGEPIKVGMVSDGATQAFDNTDELRAAQAAAEYYNNHKGGIGGRPIEVVTCETGADPAGATDCANQLVEAEVVAVALSQSAVADSVWEPLHAAGIPTLFFQTSTEDMLADTEDSFVMVNPLATLYGTPIAAAEAEDTDKIAFVLIDVPQALASFESGAADAILENAGLEYELIKAPPGTADMTVQMQQVVDSDAGVVQIVGNDAFCIAAIQGLNAVGYDGAITSISQCITDATREALPGQLEGISITSTMALGAADDPAYQLYLAVIGHLRRGHRGRRERRRHGRLHRDVVARPRPPGHLGRRHPGDRRVDHQGDGRVRLPRCRRPHVPVRRDGVRAAARRVLEWVAAGHARRRRVPRQLRGRRLDGHPALTDSALRVGPSGDGVGRPAG